MVGSPCSPRDSQESSPTPCSKASILWCSTFFIIQLSHHTSDGGLLEKIMKADEVEIKTGVVEVGRTGGKKTVYDLNVRINIGPYCRN